MDKLKPCPLCGNASNFAVLDDKHEPLYRRLVCNNCHASIADVKGNDPAKRWNHRPIEDGLRAEIEALQQELDELKEQYRWHSLEKDGLPELNQDVQLWSYTYREIRIGHFYDYEEGNETSPDIWFDDYERYECFRLDELPKKYQWRYLNAPKEGE